jgi:hypothetical protein
MAMPRPPKLLDRMSQVFRMRHYAHRTEVSYPGVRLAVRVRLPAVVALPPDRPRRPTPYLPRVPPEGRRRGGAGRRAEPRHPLPHVSP